MDGVTMIIVDIIVLGVFFHLYRTAKKRGRWLVAHGLLYFTLGQVLRIFFRYFA